MSKKNRFGRIWLYGFGSVTISAYILATITAFIMEKAWDSPVKLTTILPYLVIASIVSTTYNISFPYIIQIFVSRKFVFRRYEGLFSEIIKMDQRTQNLSNEEYLKRKSEFLSYCTVYLKDFVNLSWYKKWYWPETERELIDREQIKLSNVFFLIGIYVMGVVITFVKVGPSKTLDGHLELFILVILLISVLFLMIPIYYSAKRYIFILFKNCSIIKDSIDRLGIPLEDVYE